MSTHAHDSGRSSAFAQPPDRRIGEIDDDLRVLEVLGGSLPRAGFARDPHRVAQLGLTHRDHLYLGMVVHTIPFMNWARVQLNNNGGVIGACYASPLGLLPLGPRIINSVPPNSRVLVYNPPGLGYGIIVAVLPPLLTDGSISCPDWILQGSGSGLLRESIHTFPILGTQNNGTVLDFSANRPIDETAFEWGIATPTGLLLSIDDWMIQLRVNEMCGVWLDYYDSWLRLAGLQLRIESATHEETAGDDEGEAYYFHGSAAYPWEALGLYAPNTAFTHTNDAKAVQYSLPLGVTDLIPPGEAQPIYRYQEYGGYKGQGRMRVVSVPRRALGPERVAGQRGYSDRTHDEGVFCESIGLDGAYSLRSAKTVHIGRRVRIIVPKEVKLPEDGTGDDARAGNYNASGLAQGAQPLVADLGVTGTAQSMRRAAAVNDVIAYLVNWKALHPFHYHAADYETAQEKSQNGVFARVQDKLDFDTLTGAPFMRDPTPRKLKIDHRYNNVDIFERESFIVFHDDGTVQIGCGYGASIVLGGGDIELSAPGKVKLLPGTDLVALAAQIVLRSKGSVDVSSAQADVRIKAEKNLQMLAGNSGVGGVLIESRGSSAERAVVGKYGEDVVIDGITLRSTFSSVTCIGDTLYLRTTGGDILVDADRGNAACRVYASDVHLFAHNTVSFFFGPVDTDSAVQKSVTFDANRVAIDTPLYLGGSLYGYAQAGIWLDGDINVTGSVSAAGTVADASGGLLGVVANGFSAQVNRQLTPKAQAAAVAVQQGKSEHAQHVVEAYYSVNSLGSADFLAALVFSFRDPPTGDQYRVAGFQWSEARWQMMARLGMGTGGTAWFEPPVLSQGTETYPYPGRQNWLQNPAFLRLAELTMFDAAAGTSQDRPYLEPKLADWQPVTMAAGFTTVR